MKKITLFTLVIFSLIISPAGLAALATENNSPVDITIPQLMGGYTLSGEVVYLQPDINSMFGNYAYVNSQPREINIKSDFGWQLGIGYIFPQTANDVNVSYFRFDTDASESLSSQNGNIVPADFPVIFSTTSSYEGIVGSAFIGSIVGREEFDIDQTNFTFGQQIDVGHRLIFHPNIGVQVANVEHSLKGDYIGSENGSDFIDGSFSLPIEVTSYDDSHFNGAGPLLGMDVSYALGHGFGLVGHLNSALLVGHSQADLKAAANTSGAFLDSAIFLPYTGSVTYNVNSYRVVPTVETKVGADYTYLFNDKISTLTLEAGYQMDKFYNVVDELKGGAEMAFLFDDDNVTLTPSLPTGHQTASIDLGGPYLKLTYRA